MCLAHRDHNAAVKSKSTRREAQPHLQVDVVVVVIMQAGDAAWSRCEEGRAHPVAEATSSYQLSESIVFETACVLIAEMAVTSATVTSAAVTEATSARLSDATLNLTGACRFTLVSGTASSSAVAQDTAIAVSSGTAAIDGRSTACGEQPLRERLHLSAEQRP
eukprot:6196138-Pleurochrysis_carterae.AAC.2